MKLNVDPGFDADLEIAQRALERGWVTREGIESAILQHERTPGSRLLNYLPLTPDQRQRLRSPEVPSLPEEIASKVADPSRRVGQYVIGDLLHSGGMGRVYKAWDLKLSRWVALKFLKAVGDERSEAYFEREARLAAGLSHPNIAAIYESGQSEGERYIAMQFIPGETMDKLGRRDVTRLATLIRDAARAVGHANAHGVIHRDLKPTNLMVTPDGRVFVLDFGLARPVASKAEHSATGKAMGTPAYMSPEQARGETVDARSDVYSLGATLFECLTGRAPFSGTTIYDVLRKVEEAAPARPRRLNPRIPPDLETIILKCLEKDAARRYATAEDLADDLDRFLNHDPIQARPAGMVYRLSRNVAKRKAIAIASVASVVLAGVLSWWFLIGRPRSEELGISSEHLRRRESAMKLWAEARGLAMAGVDPEGIRRRAKDAREGFERALAIQQDPQAHFMRGRCLQLEGQDEESIRALERAHELDPENSEARIELAKAIMLKYQDSRGFPDEVRGIHDRGAGDRLNVGNLPPETADQQRLRVRGESLLAIGGVSPAQSSLINGLLAVGKGKYDQAAEALASYARAEPWDAHAMWLEATCRQFAGEFERAIEAFDRSLARLPRAETYWARGQSKFDDGRREDAIADFTKALETNPAFTPALRSRAMALTLKGLHDEAIADLTKALELNPRSVRTVNNRGIARCMKGEFKEAIADFTQAVDWDPKFTDGLTNRGCAKLDIGQVDEAIADLKASLVLDSKKAGAWYALGLAESAKGRTDEAVAAYSKSIELDPKDPKAVTNRGYVRLQEGKYDQAIADFSAALEIDGKRTQTWVSRGRAHALKGMTAEAAADWLKALEVAPSNWAHRAEVQRDLSNLEASRIFYEAVKLHESKRYAESVAQFRKIVEAHPKSAEATSSAYNAACGYALLGEKERALEWLEKAVDMGLDDSAQLEKDPDLESLRKEPKFKQLLARLKDY